MEKLTTTALVLVAFVLGASCQRFSDGNPIFRLIQLETNFAQAVAEHGNAAFVTYFADDGVELENGGGITTREDLKKRAPWPEGTSLTWTPVKAEMAASGDLGYTYGNYVFKSKDKEGKIVASYGKYVSIWKKQKDDSWKVVLDMGNSSPEPKQ